MTEDAMELLQEQVGTTHRTFENLTVESGKVEEFARAIGDENPAHRGSEAAQEQGFERVPAPLTFTRIHKFPRYTPSDLDGYHGFDFPFGEGDRLHGEQKYEFERPVYVGDTLSGDTTLVDVYEREGSRGGSMTFAVFETRVTDEDDALVLTVKRTIIGLSQEESNG